jgi:glutamine cyclotransferase
VKTRLLGLLLCALLLPAAAGAVDQYTYRVTDRKPQDPSHWVQGLQIVDDELYVSTGLHGQSRVLRYDVVSGELQDERRLTHRAFGEGLTVMDDTVYQLTWKNRAMLVYNRADLSPREVFPLPGEGWGLTHNGVQLIYSDGTNRLHFMNPENGHISHSVTVTETGKPLRGRLNELEWVEGRVWANIIFSDRIVVIDPADGRVTASVDLAGLWPMAKAQNIQHVLNGIARNPADGSIWVTGKRWPWMFQIELLAKDGDTPAAPPGDSR